MSHGDTDSALAGEHPFAGYLRTIGRGPGRARPLTRDEARDAFTLILEDRVEPVQLGAFLLLQRYRGETADDMAGFIDATRAHYLWPALGATTGAIADIDWPSYATNASRAAPWFLAAALLAGRAGLRVLMHGFNGADQEPAALQALAAFGLTAADTLNEAATAIDRHGFAYLPLSRLSPALHRLMLLRSRLGLRTPVNSLLKMINPAAAPASIQGVFHPPYLDLHANTCAQIGQTGAVVFKGGHGESERNPQKAFTLVRQAGAVVSRQDWPALIGEGRGERAPARPLSHLLAVWRGEEDDPVGIATITGTTAIALAAADASLTPAAAQQRAEALWADRHR